jgi:hypothetical protein
MGIKDLLRLELKTYKNYIIDANKLVIPDDESQRLYEWDENAVKLFLKDIKEDENNFSLSIKTLDDIYPMGQIELIENDNEFLIHDGQQRTITTTLLVYNFYKIFSKLRKKQQFEHTERRSMDKVLRDLEDILYHNADNLDNESPKLRIEPKDSNYKLILDRIMCDGEDVQMEKGSLNRMKNLIKSNNLIKNWVEEKTKDKDIIYVKEYINKIINCICFNVSISDSVSKLKRLKKFDKTNNRGIKVSTFTILRNELFMIIEEEYENGNISEEERKKYTDKVKSVWYKIQDNISEDMSKYLTQWYNYYVFDNISVDKLKNRFLSIFEIDEKCPICGKTVISKKRNQVCECGEKILTQSEKINKLIDIMYADSFLYENCHNYNFDNYLDNISKELNSEIKTILILLKDLDVKSYTKPILFYILKYKNFKNQLKDIKEILQSLLSVVLLYSKLGLGSRTNVDPLDNTKKVGKNMSNNNDYNYKDFLNDILNDNMMGKMSSNIIIKKLIEVEYDKNDKNENKPTNLLLAKVLLLISNFNESGGIRKSSLSETSAKNISGEHIISFGDKSLDVFDKNIKSDINVLRRKFCNACLINYSDNKSLGNKNFEEKKKTYKNIDIILTRKLYTNNVMEINELRENLKTNCKNILQFIWIDKLGDINDILKNMNLKIEEYFNNKEYLV